MSSTSTQTPSSQLPGNPASSVPASRLTVTPPLPTLADLGIYFVNGSGRYLVASPSGDGFIENNETQVKRLLVHEGYSKSPGQRGGLSQIDAALHDAERTRVVDYAGPLAGRKTGSYFEGGYKVLVTGAPVLIEPNPSVEWPTIKRILEEMFGHDPNQLLHLFGWLKVAYLGLRRGLAEGRAPETPGQALALAGPRNSGKTLVQSLIREVLGGRSANPYAYMTGTSRFNRELFEAENLMFGDEVASTNMAARRRFGAQLKQLTVNVEQRCEAKGQNAVTLRPYWRVTMSLNDEPENLCVMPPMDESIRDKVILLKAERPSLFESPDWSGDRASDWAKLMSELPGFLSFLESFEIPKDIRCHRFGVKEYHHPDLLLALGALSSEHHLLELIDSYLFAPPAVELPPRTKWEGTAGDLASVFATGPAAYPARQLFTWYGAAGTYLGRLCKELPQRFSRREVRGIVRYTILPPEKS